VSSLALIGPSWPLRGGIARTTTALAAALDARGNLGGFFVPLRQYPTLIYPGRHDVDPGACPRLDFAQACFGVLEPWSWPGLAARLRAARPDAIVLPFWTAAWAPLQLFLSARTHAPVVAVVHNPADHGAGLPARKAAGAVLRRCSGFLCHSRSVAQVLQERFPGTPLTVHPLPPELPAAADRKGARARFGLGRDAVAVLCFGLIRPYKGVEVLLEAVARLPRELPIVLLLAGEPWGRVAGALRRRLREPDLEGRVVARLGWVPEPEVADWFAAADVAVLPYLNATGSAVAAQALGWGLPMVASAVGGITDVVHDGVNGTLVPPGQPEALASALARLTDEALRSRLAKGARETGARWSWDSYSGGLEALVSRASAPGVGVAGDNCG
jgi:glycosyltransferase involved in cell wall biosynthesis